MIDNLYRFLRSSRDSFSLMEKFLRRKVKVHFMRILGSILPLFNKLSWPSNTVVTFAIPI